MSHKITPNPMMTSSAWCVFCKSSCSAIAATSKYDHAVHALVAVENDERGSLHSRQAAGNKAAQGERASHAPPWASKNFKPCLLPGLLTTQRA